MKKPDFTFLAVKRQLNAFKSDSFEVGIFDRSIASVVGSKPMAIRYWNSEQILESVKLLKAKNIQGNDIFIRPSGSMGMLFFDDFSRAKIDLMKGQGFEPAIVIESSPMNFQGWVRVSNSEISETLATAACKIIATKIGGDINSADWRHFGRLAGFTNRKPAYVDEIGQYPFVKIHETSDKVCSGKDRLLDDAQNYLILKEEDKSERIEQLKNHVRAENIEKADLFYLDELEKLQKHFGKNIDLSRADWVIVNKMVERGYIPDEIKTVLYQNSPAVKKRAANPLKYLNCTIKNAFAVVN